MPNKMIYVPSEILTGRADTIVAVSPRFTDYTLVNKNRAVITLRVTTQLPIVDIDLYLYNGYYDNLDIAIEWLSGMGFSTHTVDTDINKLTYMRKDDGRLMAEYILDTTNGIYNALDDLIDPTCCAVYDNPPADDEFVCSECGALVGIEDMFMSNYCESCGARVVKDDED